VIANLMFWRARVESLAEKGPWSSENQAGLGFYLDPAEKTRAGGIKSAPTISMDGPSGPSQQSPIEGSFRAGKGGGSERKKIETWRHWELTTWN